MAPTSSDDLKQVLPSTHILVLDFRLEVEDRKFFRPFPYPRPVALHSRNLWKCSLYPMPPNRQLPLPFLTWLLA